MVKEQTFIKITNHDIYIKLEEVCKAVQTTNGKVRTNRWMATTALLLIIAIIPILFMIGGK